MDKAISTRLTLPSIESGLTTYILGRSPGQGNELWDSIDSTNNRAILLASQGGEEGTLVLARQQTKGRGRQGHVWVSPVNSGIYLSLLLRPTFSAGEIPLLSFAAGVAAAEAIEQVCNLSIGLKWVNDLVFNGRKLGGILAEMPGATAQQKNVSGKILNPAVIVGLGLNLCMDTNSLELEPELAARIISLDELHGKPVDACAIVAEFCNAFEVQYNHLRHGASELVLQDWKARSITLGKRIRATIGNTVLEGLASDISASGALVLNLDSGEQQLLHAGEISIRLEDGSYA